MRGLTALNPLYVFSAEAFTDIYLEAEDYRKTILSQDKKEQEKLVEKRLVNVQIIYMIFFFKFRLSSFAIELIK